MREGSSLATIVIVNYNYERYVGTAIESALEQSHQPLEVIVVDDGSTDDSRQVISSYGERVRAIFQKNAGQGAAYNAGWREARGEFILFLDSDDVLAKDPMAKEGAAFRDRNAFRKSFLDAIMPIEDMEMYRRAADGYTTGLAGVAGNVVSIPEVLGLYRVHGDNGGGEGGVRSVAQLHHMFMRDIKREDSQHAFGDQFGFHFSADRSRFCPGHTKHRLLSRRLFPSLHPIKSDKVGDLVVSGVVSAATFPHLKLTRRLAVGMGFVVLGIVPRFLLRTHFSSIVSAQKRNRTAPDKVLPNTGNLPSTVPDNLP